MPFLARRWSWLSFAVLYRAFLRTKTCRPSSAPPIMLGLFVAAPFKVRSRSQIGN